MTRRTTLLSALALSLLLAACSSKHEEATEDSAAADSVEAQAAVEAPAEEAPPPPKLDYWQFVGPLVAGTYSGECVRLPDARRMDGTIEVDTNGKVSTAGLDADFRAAKMVMLMRSRDDKGHFSTLASLSVDDGKSGMLTLQAGKENGASLGQGDVGLACSKVTGNDKLNARPLYLSLAKLLDGKKQTIGCLDTKNLLVRRKLDFELRDGVVHIGDASFDLKAAESEGFTINDNGQTVSLAGVMPGKRTLNVFFDGAGKLTLLQAHTDQESTHHCAVES